MNFTLSEDEHKHFKDWLSLNLNSISWEGRYIYEFNSTWNGIFKPDVDLKEQFKLINKIISKINEGPLVGWFKWVKHKFICYIFVNKDLSVQDLASLSAMEITEISIILRDFFVERNPHLEEKINLEFQNGNVLSTKLNLQYSDISSEFTHVNEKMSNLEDEVMTGLEVTLYEEWSKIMSFVGIESESAKEKFSKLKDTNFWGRQFRFIQELIFLFIIGGILIILVKVGNKAYEDYLVKKISLFEPAFFWLDKNLSFKSERDQLNAEIDIKSDELEELEKIESQRVFDELPEARRYEVESDVVITSVDTLPKDFGIADLEQSEYEEYRKGGYRNVRYGRRKAYRVMMSSVNTSETKRRLIKLLDKYNVAQVDNVKPGTEIPGGIYFNLYVPVKHLKEFLSIVSGFEKQSTILESKTVYSGPGNSSKVFVWIKSI